MVSLRTLISLRHASYLGLLICARGILGFWFFEDERPARWLLIVGGLVLFVVARLLVRVVRPRVAKLLNVREEQI